MAWLIRLERLASKRRGEIPMLTNLLNMYHRQLNTKMGGQRP